MSSKTTNYNLHKIDLTDSPPDITVLNQNADIIDEKLKEVEDAAINAVQNHGLIALNTDLNTITTEGIYYSNSNEWSESFANCPTTLAFFLEVGRHAGTYQRIVEFATEAPKTFFRNYYEFSGTWSEWFREYTTADKPTLTDVGAAPDGYGIGKASGKLCEDLNTATLGGFYYYGETSLNTPSTLYGVLLVLPRGLEVGSREYTTQIAVDHQKKMFVRNYRNAGWSAWDQIGTVAVVAATVE